MKVNIKCVRSMYKLALLPILLITGSGCERTNPEQSRLLIEEYPRLYEFVYNRDEEQILSFTTAQDSIIKQQAWKAMISTPSNNLNSLIDQVILSNTEEAWAALWFKEITDEQIIRLHNFFSNDNALRKGIASVLGYKGNRESISFLLTTNESDLQTREEIALAIGRISARLDLTIKEEQEIINNALSTKRGVLTENYLYGLYRSRKKLTPSVEDSLLSLMKNFYPDSPLAEQYITRILFSIDIDKALFRFELQQFETMDVQLAIEVAQGIGRYPLTKHSTVVLNALLDHINPNVKIEALKTIQRKKLELDSSLDRAILNKIGLIKGYEPALRLEALSSISNPKQYKDLIIELASESPYLAATKYSVLKKIFTEQEVLHQLEADLATQNRLNTVFTLRELTSWWIGLEDESKSDAFISSVRKIIVHHLTSKDRSVIYELSPLLRDELLIKNSEFSLITEMLEEFSLPEDVEVYQTITALLKERFEVESMQLIDSLASVGNAALNQSLRNQGWDIPEIDVPSTEFRQVNWTKLTQLGAEPILIVETNKGDFKIQFDVMNAPATISGIQSLIEDESYKWVPFHRVIPNFVVQGGDVESQDGYGGPDYVVPTEASYTHYDRGIVGIASAGTDTEGSQFFIMNQRRPHLTGLYTIIGKVIDGMDVVDRIVQGDIIEDIYWDRTQSVDLLFE